MRRALALALAAGALGACTGLRHHSDANAPGKVTLAPPPRENGDPALYVEPDDPGEHELYVAPGVVFGPGAGRDPGNSDTDADVELGFYLRFAYEAHAKSHRSRDLPWPERNWALNVGWSPLQTGRDDGIGPAHAEVERTFYLLSAGAGVAVYPDDGNAGPQVTLACKPYGLRMRYMVETGFEIWAAFQVELPTAFTWSR